MKAGRIRGCHRIIHGMIDFAPGVLRVQIDATFQQIGIPSNIQINRLQERTDVGEGSALSARLRGFKAVTNFNSWDGQEADSAAESLVVIVITEGEFERAGTGGIEGVKARPVGNIKGV